MIEQLLLICSCTRKSATFPSIVQYTLIIGAEQNPLCSAVARTLSNVIEFLVSLRACCCATSGSFGSLSHLGRTTSADGFRPLLLDLVTA